MPLIHSDTQQAFNKNVAEMIHSGHPQKQAVAAAYSVQRHVKADEHEERKIERENHEKLKYGR